MHTVISRIEIEKHRKRFGKGMQMGMARKNLLPGALAVGLCVSLLANVAAANDELVAYRAPVIAAVIVDGQMFRSEIDSYIRSLNEELRTTLGQDLRRDLAPKLELASNELRARG